MATQSILSDLGCDVDRDRVDLLRLAKVPKLKREFGFMSLVGFSSSVLLTWESLLAIFAKSLENGGSAGLVWGFLVVWLGNWSAYTCLCELASMAPTSGGQYFWVSLLAPPSSRQFASYVTGWLTVGGWQVATASIAFVSSSLLQGIAILTSPNYIPHRWHATLLLWVIQISSIPLNALGQRILPKMEGIILVLHWLGFFAILLPLVILGNHIRPSEVFETFANSGGWVSEGLSFLVGMTGPVFTFTGVDAAIHMSEEVHDASLVVPRSIMVSIALNGALGLAILIAVMFTVGDIQTILNTPTNFPCLEIFKETAGVSGAAFMGGVITTMNLCAAIATLAAASRMLWSFCRDKGIPGWSFLSHVDQKWSVPVRCIALTSIISIILSLIHFGSVLAFNDIISVAVASLSSSYLVVLCLLLWRRSTGVIHPYDGSGHPLAQRIRLTWGPWRVPGAIGTFNNAVACCYLSLVFFFSFWPTATPVDAGSMNYSSVVFGGLVLLIVASYFLYGKKRYNGPVIETHSAQSIGLN